MSQLTFTAALHRHVHAPSLEIAGNTVRELFDAAFAQHPTLRSYVLDDQGGLRRHVDVYVGGKRIVDRERQSDPVDGRTEVFVMQALSGG